MGGGGPTYDYGFRIYNAGIGKFLSVDPLTDKYPWLTPYQFASNNPITNIDIDGLEGGEGEAKSGTMGNSPNIIPAQQGARSVVDNAVKQGAAKGAETQVAKQTAKKITAEGVKKGGKAFLGPVLAVVLTAIEGTSMGTGDNTMKPTPSEPPSPQQMEQITNQLLDNMPGKQPSGDEDDDDDVYIYRGGAFSDKNLTPRPGKDDAAGHPKRGLSTFVTPEQATMGQGGKAQKISVKMLRKFGFEVKFDPDGHASIRPPSQKVLENWAKTRPELDEGKQAHVLTDLVKQSRVEEVVVPKQGNGPRR